MKVLCLLCFSLKSLILVFISQILKTEVVLDNTNSDKRSVTDNFFFLEGDPFLENLPWDGGALRNVEYRNTVNLTPVVHEDPVPLVLVGHPSLQRQGV